MKKTRRKKKKLKGEARAYELVRARMNSRMDRLGRDLDSNCLVLTSVQPLDQRKKRGVREGFEGGFARESDKTKDLEGGRGRRL